MGVKIDQGVDIREMALSGYDAAERKQTGCHKT